VRRLLGRLLCFLERHDVPNFGNRWSEYLTPCRRCHTSALERDSEAGK
jgi:hypothetical protein